jgi:membrane peptidoglycan carboxypeptidase
MQAGQAGRYPAPQAAQQPNGRRPDERPAGPYPTGQNPAGQNPATRPGPYPGGQDPAARPGPYPADSRRGRRAAAAPAVMQSAAPGAPAAPRGPFPGPGPYPAQGPYAPQGPFPPGPYQQGPFPPGPQRPQGPPGPGGPRGPGGGRGGGGGGGGRDGRGGGTPSPRPRRRLIDYPRANRRGVFRWMPSWKLVFGTTITLVMSMIVGLLVAYATTTVPPVQSITQAQTTTVLYSQGQGVIGKFVYEQQNRTIVSINDIPQYLRMAVISAEDRTFYQNKGISPMGILRAAWNDLRGQPLQGGSTITQQYVKNTRITNERSITRKIKEFFISIKIANQTDKNALLGDYLNTIYFGRGCYGIQAAARAYFGKNATFDPKRPDASLSLQQAAYLAGIIDGPELYDYDSTDSAAVKSARTARAKARYDYVLDGMVTLGVISQADRNGKYAKMPIPNPKAQPQATGQVDDQTGYMTQMVRSELTDLSATHPELAPSMIDKGGYNIYTTFDKSLTAQAVKSVQDTLGPRTIKGKPNWPAGTETGLTAIDPTTGAVRAIYGGDGKRSQNAATQDRPQAGSTFKLFSLLAALEGPDHTGENGIALDSEFSGASPYRYTAQYAGKGGSASKVFNDGNEQMPDLNLKDALKHSVNTIFAQLNEQVTPQHTQSAAWRAGIPKTDPSGHEVVGSEISNTLGNAPVSTMDMASAYGTVAAEGMYAKPYVIDRIVSSDGTVLYRHQNAPERRFTSDVCDDATAALQGPVSSGGTASFAGSHMDRPVAGKTGTVGSLGSRHTKSAWFVGFTPQLVAAVAMYRVDPKTGGQDDVIGWGQFSGQDMQGGYFPVRVWTDFMQAALKNAPIVQLPTEKDVGVVNAMGQAAQQAAQQAAASPSPSGSPTDGASPSPTDPNAPTGGNTGPGTPGASPTDTAGNGNGVVSPGGNGASTPGTTPSPSG